MQGRAAEARQRTLERVQDLGFPVPPAHLPVLEDNEFPRSARGIEEVIQRALVLNVRINLAFGMPPESARDWLTTNGLMGSLSPRESALVGGSARSGEQEKLQVEALWALAWALQLAPSLDHRAYCGDELATLLPDLRAQESAEAWRSRAEPSLRSDDELLTELDLLYAMTWGVADANLSGAPTPGEVDPYVFWERRRALEFVRADSDAGHADWDEIDLST